MALDDEDNNNDGTTTTAGRHSQGMGNGHNSVKSDADEEDEEEDEEPKLKYASLTKSQGAVYRNGDATSTFLVAGDKMVTHCTNYAANLILKSNR